jgi:hypothetical protein
MKSSKVRQPGTAMGTAGVPVCRTCNIISASSSGANSAISTDRNSTDRKGTRSHCKVPSWQPQLTRVPEVLPASSAEPRGSACWPASPRATERRFGPGRVAPQVSASPSWLGSGVPSAQAHGECFSRVMAARPRAAITYHSVRFG